jgi:hypothetical protein
VAEEFERLWAVAGLADALAARLADPQERVDGEEPADVVLAVHRTQLTIALCEARELGQVGSELGPDELADSLLGVYLSRRLAGRPTEGWARAAIAAVASR